MKQKPTDPNLKAERVQGTLQVPLERLQAESDRIGDWQTQFVPVGTPSVVVRHFPQPSFSDAVVFLSQVAALIDKHGRTAIATVNATVDGTGVTVQLGQPPRSGIAEGDLEIAAALTASS